MPELLSAGAAAAVSAWLVTYAVHGTAWLAGAWLVTAILRRLSDALAEGLWKLAVLGPVLTASLQLACVPATAPDLAPFVPPVRILGEVAPLVPRSLPAPLDVAAADLPIDTNALIATLALGGALIALARGFWLRLRLHRALGARGAAPREVTAELTVLAARAGFSRRVRTSVVPGLATPIAFGVVWPEVCLPERALGDVDPERRRGMLAHELAHLQRQDPLWLYLFDLLQRAFFWQPLLRVARSRLQVLAEYRCDALAARWTSSTAVAGGLLEVAGWIMRSPRAPELAPAMAARGSALKRRVDRLLDGTTEGGRRGRWTRPLGVALLAATVAAMPGMALPATAVVAPEQVPPVVVASPLQALGRDHAALLDEFAGLQSELRALRSGADPELRALLRELERRLQRLDQRHAALLARLGAQPPSHALSEPEPRR